MKKLQRLLESVTMLEKVKTSKNQIYYMVDYGKYKGSYISINVFDYYGLGKKEYIINYGMIENNERIIFEFKNIAADGSQVAEKIIKQALQDLKLC